MAGKKRGAPAPRPRSGFVTEEQRKTERITLRLGPNAMARLEAFAKEHGWTFAKVVTEALGALERELEAEDAHNAAIDDGAEPEAAQAIFGQVYMVALRKREARVRATLLRSESP